MTGVCLAFPAGRAPRTELGVTAVTMRLLAAHEIEAYAASGEPFGKAGGYAIQERGDRFVTAVEGSWSNVVGLPLELVVPMLRAEGLL
jgi:septum formation protein